MPEPGAQADKHGQRGGDIPQDGKHGRRGDDRRPTGGRRGKQEELAAYNTGHGRGRQEGHGDGGNDLLRVGVLQHDDRVGRAKEMERQRDGVADTGVQAGVAQGGGSEEGLAVAEAVAELAEDGRLDSRIWAKDWLAVRHRYVQEKAVNDHRARLQRLAEIDDVLGQIVKPGKGKLPRQRVLARR